MALPLYKTKDHNVGISKCEKSDLTGSVHGPLHGMPALVCKCVQGDTEWLDLLEMIEYERTEGFILSVMTSMLVILLSA